MKVLFFSSNPEGADTLLLEREINELQRLALESGGSDVSFVFLPDLAFDELEQNLSRIKPDILHIAAHADARGLGVSNDKKAEANLSAEALAQILSLHPPKLVYVNGCKSETVAEAIADGCMFSIGVDAEIKNHVARRCAVAFYQLVVRGETLQRAYDLSAAMAKTHVKGLRMTLFPKSDERSKHLTFCQPLRIVAHFEDHDFDGSHAGYNFRIGVIGCPKNYSQIVIGTDDEDFVHEDKHGVIDTDPLLSVARSAPTGGEVWLNHSWPGVYGDIHLFALQTNADGTVRATSCTLIKALENFYQVYYRGPDGVKFPKKLTAALADLVDNDGCGVRPKGGAG